MVFKFVYAETLMKISVLPACAGKFFGTYCIFNTGTEKSLWHCYELQKEVWFKKIWTLLLRKDKKYIIEVLIFCCVIMYVLTDYWENKKYILL